MKIYAKYKINYRYDFYDGINYYLIIKYKYENSIFYKKIEDFLNKDIISYYMEESDMLHEKIKRDVKMLIQNKIIKNNLINEENQKNQNIKNTLCTGWHNIEFIFKDE